MRADFIVACVTGLNGKFIAIHPSGGTMRLFRHDLQEITVTNRFQRITPFLWFTDTAEEAAKFYVSIFDNSRIVATTRYTKEAAQPTGAKEGAVMTIAFELDGQPFTALNGFREFPFSIALSLVINCHAQDEVDHFWSKLSAGGDDRAQQCGWLKDKFGLSWQVVPTALPELLTQSSPEKSRAVVKALMAMKKLDIAALRAAAG
jgi:predicted 3-demethylubiquinone-9 3-methyltransferase (glyoxalase superfamily)